MNDRLNASWNWKEDYEPRRAYEHKCPECMITFYGGKERIVCRDCETDYSNMFGRSLEMDTALAKATK